MPRANLDVLRFKAFGVERVFTFNEVYGQEPSGMSNAAWDSMIPSMPLLQRPCSGANGVKEGRGFVKLPPDVDPGPNKSENGTYCVSVYHQLHCLVRLFPSIGHDLDRPSSLVHVLLLRDDHSIFLSSVSDLSLPV